jgi:peptide/nickel transport system substrate-binding protein
LSQITPLPQAVWDKETPTGPVGNYDETAAGAKAVYAVLDYESRDIPTYDNNPLWKVVDGPWKLKSMDPDGNVAMVPNTAYSGPVRPTLTEFFEVPYQTDSSELEDLAGATSVANTTIDYGYLPDEDVGQGASLTYIYNLEPWSGWQIMYLPENFTNPSSGPIFKQLYFRQAMQHLVDQDGLISEALERYGYSDFGPVPTKPSGLADAFEQTNPYPYSPSKAISLLQANGWTVDAGGVSTCTHPGVSSGECGAGIPMDAKASFGLQYASGSRPFDKEMALLKSDFSAAGIHIDLTTAPFENIIGELGPCACTAWDMGSWDVGWVYQPDYYPTGEDLWSCSELPGYGGAANAGGYCDARANALIMATQTSNSGSAMNAYEDYLATQLPDIWMPVADMQLSEINKDLKGAAPQSPLFFIYPEGWRWS